MRIIPQGMRFWEDGGDVEELMSIKDIVSKYEAGYAGCWSDPDSKAEFRAYIQSQGFSYLGIDNAYRFGWAGDAAGKLIIPFVFNDRVFPGCMPGPAQARGDCVSHGAKNAALLTLCCEIVAGKPDEVSGKLEGTPEISAEGIRQGVLSTEAIYWWRRHGGDGWQRIWYVDSQELFRFEHRPN
jgi:hypothetical protein